MRKKCLAAFAAFVLSLAALLVPQLLGEGLLFEPGAYYIFYAGSAGSDAHITLVGADEAAAAKRGIRSLTGESTAYADETSAFAAVEKYGAALVFCERAGGVENYYYYSPRLGGAVGLGGRAVNLHVAVAEGRSAVGSPLIFGGY